MDGFFRPTISRIVITLILALYVYTSITYLISFNGWNITAPDPLTTTEKVLGFLSYPGSFLGAPFFITLIAIHWSVAFIIEFIFLYSIAPSLIRAGQFFVRKIKNGR